MLDWIKDNSKAFGVAVTFHIIFLGALFINWQMDEPQKIVMEQGDIVQVTSVDANRYEAEIQKIEDKKQAKLDQEKKRQEREDRRAREYEKQKKKEKAEKLKRKKAAEAKKKKEQKKKAEQEKARKLAKKKAAEDKRKKEAAEKLKKEEAQRKEEQKKKEEAKRKEEQKKAEELRRKKEEKRQEDERKRKAAADKKRQAELKQQEERNRAERARRSKGIINKHVAMIAQKIERNWRQPLDAPARLNCKIDIVLLPSGNVVSVKVVETSGNQSFDRSVETAVRKASPLPVPSDSVIFKQFEVMRLRFEPGR